MQTLRTRSSSRDEVALATIKSIFQLACEAAVDAVTRPAVSAWLQNGARHPLPRVCLVVDEIGKALALARGVASVQHCLYFDMRSFTTRLEVVFVGTGTDSFQPTAGRLLRPSTDPSKISMITIRPAPMDEFRLLERALSRGGAALFSLVKCVSITHGLLAALVTHPRLTVYK